MVVSRVCARVVIYWSYLCLGLASCALQSKDDLLGGLSPLVEDGLGVTSVTGLLAVVTTLILGEQRSLASLVLCAGSVCAWYVLDCGLLTGDLVLGVLLAVLALAVGKAGL